MLGVSNPGLISRGIELKARRTLALGGMVLDEPHNRAVENKWPAIPLALGGSNTWLILERNGHGEPISFRGSARHWFAGPRLQRLKKWLRIAGGFIFIGLGVGTHHVAGADAAASG